MGVIDFWQRATAAATTIQALARGRAVRRAIMGRDETALWMSASGSPTTPAKTACLTPFHLLEPPSTPACHTHQQTLQLYQSIPMHLMPVKQHFTHGLTAQDAAGSIQLHLKAMQPPPPPPPPPPPQQQAYMVPPPIQTSFQPPSPSVLQRSMSDGAELQSPRTAYRSHIQPRVHSMEVPQFSAHHFSPYHPAPATPEQQREQLLTAIVIDRLCAWGEHRAPPDWPSELVSPGPIPAIVDALLSTRTRSLTLPQLITAIKERTGGGSCGKALDMLNLKAYVRCFPTLFILHSGRTPAGRPLDAVELRAVDAVGVAAQQLESITSRIERHALATSIAANAWSSHVMPLGRNTNTTAPSPALTISPPVIPQPCANVPASCANQPRHTSAFSRVNPMSPLQPKDLFGAALGAQPFGGQNKDDAATMPISDVSWTPSDAARFALFSGTDSTNASSQMSNASISSKGDKPPAILAQLNELFGNCAVDAPTALTPAAAVAPPTSAMSGSDMASARRAFMRRFELDRLFDEAVDRAIKHNVSSPVEFIAQEFLRMAPPTSCV